MCKSFEQLTFKECCEAVVGAADHTHALDWAYNYAGKGLELVKQGAPKEYLHAQALYLSGNLSKWRGVEAKQVRKSLKNMIAGKCPLV